MPDGLLRLIIGGVLLLHGLGHGGAIGALWWVDRRQQLAAAPPDREIQEPDLTPPTPQLIGAVDGAFEVRRGLPRGWHRSR